ncbi:unnamed protein product [Effrenium voratum]|nr:unnamed protein product [Effrenium voratum]
MAATGPGMYDCLAGIHNWQQGWSLHKKVWCCDNKKLGCATEQYNCDTAVSSWGSAQRSFCCREHHRGCAKPTIPEETDDNGAAKPLFDCRTGWPKGWKAWSTSKKDFCCSNYARGCKDSDNPEGHIHSDLSPRPLPVSGFDCQAGLANWHSWKSEKKTWCCAQRDIACSHHGSFDCEAGSPKTWKTSKKDYCCLYSNKGCEFDASDSMQPAAESHIYHNFDYSPYGHYGHYGHDIHYGSHVPVSYEPYTHGHGQFGSLVLRKELLPTRRALNLVQRKELLPARRALSLVQRKELLPARKELFSAKGALSLKKVLLAVRKALSLPRLLKVLKELRLVLKQVRQRQPSQRVVPLKELRLVLKQVRQRQPSQRLVPLKVLRLVPTKLKQRQPSRRVVLLKVLRLVPTKGVEGFEPTKGAEAAEASSSEDAEAAASDGSVAEERWFTVLQELPLCILGSARTAGNLRVSSAEVPAAKDFRQQLHGRHEEKDVSNKAPMHRQKKDAAAEAAEVPARPWDPLELNARSFPVREVVNKQFDTFFFLICHSIADSDASEEVFGSQMIGSAWKDDKFDESPCFTVSSYEKVGDPKADAQANVRRCKPRASCVLCFTALLALAVATVCLVQAKRRSGNGEMGIHPIFVNGPEPGSPASYKDDTGIGQGWTEPTADQIDTNDNVYDCASDRGRLFHNCWAWLTVLDSLVDAARRCSDADKDGTVKVAEVLLCQELPPPVADRVAHGDENGDGRLDVTEFHHALRGAQDGKGVAGELYKVADANGNGEVDDEELEAVEQQGLLPESLVAQLWASDADGDGVLSELEFGSVSRPFTQGRGSDLSQAAWGILDGNDDGIVSKDRLKAVAAWAHVDQEALLQFLGSGSHLTKHGFFAAAAGRWESGGRARSHG